MSTSVQANSSVEDRLRALEDRLAIYQLVCGYGYAVDGLNAEAVGVCFSEDAVYAVGDFATFEGRDEIAAITSNPTHLGLVHGGCAHMSTLPYVLVDGDRATATCHTMVPVHADGGFVIARLSASRLELERERDGQWRIVRRQNWLLDGNPEGPALLARLNDGQGSP